MTLTSHLRHSNVRREGNHHVLCGRHCGRQLAVRLQQRNQLWQARAAGRSACPFGEGASLCTSAELSLSGGTFWCRWALSSAHLRERQLVHFIFVPGEGRCAAPGANGGGINV